jgi:acyl-coenzyme A thioesterase PaaI-like protein
MRACVPRPLDQLPDLKSRVSTVDIRVDYLRSCPPADLWCEAHVVHSGSRLIRVDMKAFNDSEPHHPVAIGRSSFAVHIVSEASLAAAKKNFHFDFGAGKT